MMLRVLVCSIVFTVVHGQFGPPSSLNTFLTPPGARRDLRPPSPNVVRDVRSPSRPESFISGSSPMFRPKIPHPQRHRNRLPLVPRPNFQRGPPSNRPENHRPIEEDVAFDGESLVNLDSANARSPFEIQEELNEKQVSPPEDPYSFTPDSSPFFDDDEEDQDDEPVRSDPPSNNEIPSESQVFEFQNKPEDVDNSGDIFRPFNFDEEPRENNNEDEEEPVQNRELSEGGNGFQFPSFSEASKSKGPENYDEPKQLQRLPLHEAERNIYSPPVYNSKPKGNNFKPPSYRPKPKPKATSHSSSMSGSSDVSFNAPSNNLKHRPAEAPSRPKYQFREQAPKEQRPNFQERFREQPEEAPKISSFNPFSKPEDLFNPNQRRRPQRNPEQPKKAVFKRRPYKAQEREPLYESPNSENYLYEGDEDEEESKPDRLTVLLLQTQFNCIKRNDGYYADEQLGCEVFHFCQDSVKHSWLCPNGGSFHQVHLICMPKGEDNICEKSSRFHFVNDYLYLETDDSTDKDKSYVKRYYPEGFEEGIAVLEDRHAISEQSPPPSKPYRSPQQPPKSQYQFKHQSEGPRQVQLGLPLRQAQRKHFEEDAQSSEDYHYEVYENPDLNANQETQEPDFNHRPFNQGPQNHRRQFSSFDFEQRRRFH